MKCTIVLKVVYIIIITSSVQAMEKVRSKVGHLSNKKVSAPILMPNIYTYIMSISAK